MKLGFKPQADGEGRNIGIRYLRFTRLIIAQIGDGRTAERPDVQKKRILPYPVIDLRDRPCLRTDNNCYNSA